MDGAPAVRVVRPRPLGLTDRIPVFWAGQEPTQELKQIDGGALYRHLVAASTPTSSKKRKRGQKYQAPKEGAPHEHWTGHQEQQQPLQQATGPIHIPSVRLVADYSLNREAAEHHGPMIEGDMAAAPYLRHKEHLDMYDDEHAEYDADDSDIAWLDSINSKNGQGGGILAAAIGLYHQVSARISGSGDGGAELQQQQQQQQPLRLSVDEFERAMELLETAHFDAVKAWWDKEQAGPSTSAPRMPKIPAMKSLLPRAEGLKLLSSLLPDPKLAAQVLDYWVRRRNEEGGPLLARLWFEQPWKLVAFAHDIVDDDEDFDEHLPFMAVEPRSKQKQTRRGGQRRKLNQEDALEALYGLRNELETVRTLADQVRKREKLKRQLLLLAQQEWQARRQLGLPPGKPGKGKGKAAGSKAATKKAVSKKAAAGTSKAAAAAAAGPSKAAAAGPGRAAPSKAAAAAGSGRTGAVGLKKAVASAAAAAAGPSKAAAAAAAGGPKKAAGAVKAGPNAGVSRKVTLVSPRAGAAGGSGWGQGSSRGNAATLPSPPGSPGTELNKALARVALAAAAAASPHEGDKGRQTRTSAYAAAAEFELTFAAKRRRLLDNNKAAEAAAAAASEGGPLGAAGAGKAPTAAAAAGAAADAGRSRPQKKRAVQPAAAGSNPPGARGGAQKGRAAAAAGGEGAEPELAKPSRLATEGLSPSPSAVSDDSEADYEVDEDEVSSDDTELPSDLVFEGAAAAAAAGQGQQRSGHVGRHKQTRREAAPKARAGGRGAAAAARAAAAAGSSDIELLSDADDDSDSSEGQQQQGRGVGPKGRQGNVAHRQQPGRRAEFPVQGVKAQQKQHAQGQVAAGAARVSRRGGVALPPVASSSELQMEADRADTDSDSAQPRKKPRRPAVAAAVAAPQAPGGRKAAAASAGDDGGEAGADSHQVLKPLNQQSKHSRSHAEVHKGGKDPSPAAAAAGVPVAASSGRGAAVPARAAHKGLGSGGSVRRSAAGAAAATAADVHKRRKRGPASQFKGAVGKAELRALGTPVVVTEPRRRGH